MPRPALPYPRLHPHPLPPERKLRMRQAQVEAKREIEEYRALRDSKLRSVQPEAQALEERIRRVTQQTTAQITQLE